MIERPPRQSDRVEDLSPSAGGAMLLNISDTGAGCLFKREYPAGKRLDVSLSGTKVTAEVVYCRRRTEGDYRVGLRFCSVTPELQQVLSELVDRYSKGVPVTFSVLDEQTPKKA